MTTKHYSFLFIPFLLIALSALGQQFPEKPQPAKFVNDFAGMLQAGEVQYLESKLHNYFDTTSTQIVVVTISSLEGYDIEGYANELARNWGIGEKGKDNGILLLVAQNERKVRIEVGYGLEPRVPDAAAKEIIRDIIKPNFKAGNYGQGIDQSIDKIILLASGEYKASATKEKGGGVSVLLLVGIVVVILLFSFISKYRQVKRSHIGHGLDFWTIMTILNAMGNSGRNRGGGGGWGGGSSGGGSNWDFGGGDFGGGGASGDW